MHEKWKKHLPYLNITVNIKTPEEMAEELGVDPKELKLFLHNHRLFKISNKENLILRILRAKFTYPEYFKPTAQFFNKTGIKRGRFWQLYKGDKIPTSKEIKAIVSHLKITDKEIYAGYQLDLFDTDVL